MGVWDLGGAWLVKSTTLWALPTAFFLGVRWALWALIRSHRIFHHLVLRWQHHNPVILLTTMATGGSDRLWLLLTLLFQHDCRHTFVLWWHHSNATVFATLGRCRVCCAFTASCCFKNGIVLVGGKGSCTDRALFFDGGGRLGVGFERQVAAAIASDQVVVLRLSFQTANIVVIGLLLLLVAIDDQYLMVRVSLIASLVLMINHGCFVWVALQMTLKKLPLLIFIDCRSYDCGHLWGASGDLRWVLLLKRCFLLPVTKRLRYSDCIDLISILCCLCDIVMEFAILDDQRANDIGSIKLLILLSHFSLRSHLFRINLKGHELVIDVRDRLMLLLSLVRD